MFKLEIKNLRHAITLLIGLSLLSSAVPAEARGLLDALFNPPVRYRKREPAPRRKTIVVKPRRNEQRGGEQFGNDSFVYRPRPRTWDQPEPQGDPYGTYDEYEPYDTFDPYQNPQARRVQPRNNNGGNAAQLAHLGAWTLQKTQWTQDDETGFGNFVRAIGRSKCTTVDACLRSEANPYRDTDPGKGQYKFWSDCADWPYFLRMYYAWKNGLPFAYISGFSPIALTPEQQALIDSGKEKMPEPRYSWNGNTAASRARVPDLNGGVTNFFAVHEQLQNSVSTGTMRIDPRTNQGDMYTPAVRPGAIRPGTVVYDPAGHAGIVYDVTADGQVHLFDAGIDQKSIGHKVYSNDQIGRSKITHGGWFQNFRPLVVDGAEYDAWSGTFVGGKIRLLKNEEIPDYSIEMFGTTTTEDGRSAYKVNTENGPIVTTSFQEFLRRRMFKGKYRLNVITEFKTRMSGMCSDMNQRAGMVQDTARAGIAKKAHATKLPDNIFGGSGEWDLHSSPGGDLRRRNLVTTTIASAKELAQYIQDRNDDYIYEGNDLRGDLIQVARDTLKTCVVTYTNSKGEPVKISLENAMNRLPRMSFSPWHCPELRWGASTEKELASCPDVRDPVKFRWYKAQQTLRNRTTRDTSLFTGYTLEQLEQKAPELGPANPPNMGLIQQMEAEL